MVNRLCIVGERNVRDEWNAGSKYSNITEILSTLHLCILGMFLDGISSYSIEFVFPLFIMYPPGAVIFLAALGSCLP